MKRMTVAILLVALATCVALGLEENKKASATITEAEIRDHMFFLASDFLGGRVVGSEGFKIACEYAAAQMKNAGLEPLFKDADGNPSYLQEIKLTNNSVKSLKPLKVTYGESSNEIAIGDEIKPAFIMSPVEKTLPAVFCGYGISEPEHGWDDLADLSLEGKAAVVIVGAPMKDGEPVLPKEVNQRYAGLQGSQAKGMRIMSKSPALVIFVLPKEQEPMFAMVPSRMGNSNYTLPGSSAEHGMETNFLIAKSSVIEKIFSGLDLGGDELTIENLLKHKISDVDGLEITQGFEVEREETITYNVGGYVPGTDEELAKKYVTVGAHLDHVTSPDGRVANGADDNASGSIGVLEAAEAFVETPGKRSAAFILYGAEEVGLLGSRYFLQNCPFGRENIIANINLDMIGRSDARHEQDRAHYAIGSDRICQGFEDMIKRVNANTVNWPLDFENGDSSFGGSDHFSYASYDIPVVFFFSGVHRDLHRPTDDPEKIDFEKMVNITRLTYELALELSNSGTPCAK